MLSLVLAFVAYLGFIRQRSDSDTSAPVVSGRVTTQKIKPPAATAAIAQRPAAVSPPVAAPPVPRHAAATVRAAAPDVKRTASNNPDKPRVDVSKHLRAAHADLQQSNLSATKARLKAAIAAQPDNLDALRMRSALSEREQQRDALLSIARGCKYIEQWACVRLNAGTALLVDSSSGEARRLVEHAMREPEFTSAPPADPAPAPPHEESNPATHH
ncbi:hypothetical protein [Paraburkholderia sp. SIMBA_030]|uniref:hypothetical protein n=1 Tax=Paraburkholderia sp. SIMBA_030 TaxID=3085773 RepID=UPI00397BA57E